METLYILLTWKTKPKTEDQNLPWADPPFCLLEKYVPTDLKMTGQFHIMHNKDLSSSFRRS